MDNNKILPDEDVSTLTYLKRMRDEILSKHEKSLGDNIDDDLKLNVILDSQAKQILSEAKTKATITEASRSKEGDIQTALAVLEAIDKKANNKVATQSDRDVPSASRPTNISSEEVSKTKPIDDLNEFFNEEGLPID